MPYILIFQGRKMYKKFFVFGVLLFLSVPLAIAENGWKMVGRDAWKTTVKQGSQMTDLGVMIARRKTGDEVVFSAHRQCRNSGIKQSMVWTAGDTESIVRDCTNTIWDNVTPLKIENIAPPLPEAVQKKILEMRIRKGTLIISETHPSGAFFFA